MYIDDEEEYKSVRLMAVYGKGHEKMQRIKN